MSYKLYYIDDEPELLEIFKETFSCPQIDIKTFTDPETAIEMMKSEPPDLIFIDQRLPNTTGDEVASKIHAQIPKVLITGDLIAKTQTHFLMKFEKPYDIESIDKFIKDFFKINN